jgi:hypothetical protein
MKPKKFLTKTCFYSYIVSISLKTSQDMSIVIDGKRYYKTSEACKLAGVSRATLFRWLKNRTFEDVPNKDRRGWRLFEAEGGGLQNQNLSFSAHP